MPALLLSDSSCVASRCDFASASSRSSAEKGWDGRRVWSEPVVGRDACFTELERRAPVDCFRFLASRGSSVGLRERPTGRVSWCDHKTRCCARTVENIALVVACLADVCRPLVTSDARADTAVHPLLGVVVARRREAGAPTPGHAAAATASTPEAAAARG